MEYSAVFKAYIMHEPTVMTDKVGMVILNLEVVDLDGLVELFIHDGFNACSCAVEQKYHVPGFQVLRADPAVSERVVGSSSVVVQYVERVPRRRL